MAVSSSSGKGKKDKWPVNEFSEDDKAQEDIAKSSQIRDRASTDQVVAEFIDLADGGLVDGFAHVEGHKVGPVMYRLNVRDINQDTGEKWIAASYYIWVDDRGRIESSNPEFPRKRKVRDGCENESKEDESC